MAKAACWTVTDTEARKRGEQTGLDTPYYFYHLTYEVSNDSTLNLPSTGGFSNIKTYLPLIGGFILILAAGFYYLKKKKGMKILKKKK